MGKLCRNRKELSDEEISRAILSASQQVDGNTRIVLESISKLALEDKQCYINFIAKIGNKSGLNRYEVCKIFKDIRENKNGIEDIININIIAEGLE